MPKKYEFYLLTKLLDIDIDIAIFCKYRIDIVSKLKKWYRYSSIRYTYFDDVIRMCQYGRKSLVLLVLDSNQSINQSINRFIQKW